MNYLLIFAPLHSKLFEDKKTTTRVLFIFVSTAFSIGLAHNRNAIYLCHIKEGGGEEGLRLFFFLTFTTFSNKELSTSQHSFFFFLFSYSTE